MTLAHKLRSGRKSESGSKRWVVVGLSVLLLAVAFVAGKYAADRFVEGSRYGRGNEKNARLLHPAGNETREKDFYANDALSGKGFSRSKEPAVTVAAQDREPEGKKPHGGSYKVKTVVGDNGSSVQVKTEKKVVVVKSVETPSSFSAEKKSGRVRASEVTSVVAGESRRTLRKIDYLEKATEAFRAGNYAEAIRLYNKVLRLDPKNRKALLNLATIYYQIGEREKARELFIKLLKIDPRNPHVLNNLGVICMEKGNCSSAVYYFDRALRIDPTFKAALINKALCLKRMGKLDEAIEVCTHGIRLFPDEYRFYLYLGVCLYEKGDTEAAYKFLSRAYQLLDDKNSSVALMLRRLLER